MARNINRLTEVEVKAAAKGSKLGDGGGLQLTTDKSGAKRWSLRYMLDGRAREMGIGPYPEISLKVARLKAADASKLIAEGVDPLELRDASLPFGDVAEKWMKGQRDGWSTGHANEVDRILRTYGAPFWNKPVTAVTTADVLAVLEPIWSTKPETARRTRERIEAVFDAAKALGALKGENPARWRGNLKTLLTTSKAKTVHHRAAPYADMPAIWQALASRDAVAARAAQFILLTACREAEGAGATWDEIDVATATWTIPAERMKKRRAHRIALSPAALKILEEVRPLTGGAGPVFVWRGEKAISVNAVYQLCLRAGVLDKTSVHGFRSAFRGWAAESGYSYDLAEHALAHLVGDATERAYARSDLLDQRRPMMKAWGEFVSG